MLLKNLVPLVVSLFILTTSALYAQYIPFSADSITMEEDEVVFVYNFKTDLGKEDIYKNINFFLTSELDPYFVKLLTNSYDSIVCEVTDYLEIESNVLAVFAMYMRYTMELHINDGSCDLVVGNIAFMEKSDFERHKNTYRAPAPIEYSGKEVMVDKRYSQFLKKNSSDKITNAAIDRFNRILESLNARLEE